MIEYETLDGRQIWISALSIRAVEPTSRSNEIALVLSDAVKVYVKGEPASIAAHITRMLNMIHTSAR